MRGELKLSFSTISLALGFFELIGISLALTLHKVGFQGPKVKPLGAWEDLSRLKQEISKQTKHSLHNPPHDHPALRLVKNRLNSRFLQSMVKVWVCYAPNLHLSRAPTMESCKELVSRTNLNTRQAQEYVRKIQLIAPLGLNRKFLSC